MPHTCFSFPAEVPPGTGNRDAARADLFIDRLGDLHGQPFLNL